MDSPRKFNDCYFYYYSTCTKGDNCVFRHEPSALGCETMCSAWQQGKCTDTKCKLRHMELRKNRKQIPCYWETQPGGCRKKHCPFMHKNPEARTDGIAPSQPAPIVSAQESSSGAEPIVDSGMMRPNVLAPSAGPPSVPVAVLLQQQRQQVVLDSAILGVLPGTSELLPRRVVHSHAHAHAHAHAHSHAHAHAHDPSAYALPVDPLVVNFEEESDNESAPSWTPTKKVNQDDSTRIGRTQSQELERLEEIQAESAAYYSYEHLPPVEVHKLRKIVRKNLNVKYDKLSLDEISGKKPETEKKSSLDFKVLSLDEIRARKKVSEATIIKTPITLNLNRKRKLSTHETITTSGNKILKVVRSNSVVYKKLDNSAQAQPSQAKAEQKPSPETNNRKRTLSELCDLYELEDELVDNCYEFKKIKIAEQIPKPRLVRHRSATKSISESKDDYETGKSNNESDNEVQFVGEELGSSDVSVVNDDDVIDVDSTKMGDPVDIVDLCDQDDNASDPDLDLDKSVPDVVASCQKNVNKNDNADKILLNEIDALLDEEL